MRGGGGNRTRVQGFAGPCLSHSATPPGRGPYGSRSAPPSGRRDSNPRPSPWQGDALPTEPRPRARPVRAGKTAPAETDVRSRTLADPGRRANLPRRRTAPGRGIRRARPPGTGTVGAVTDVRVIAGHASARAEACPG